MRMRKRFGCLFAILCISAMSLAPMLAPSRALAAPITINNHSFENGTIAGEGDFRVHTVQDWDPYNPDNISGDSLGTINPIGTDFFTSPNAVPHGNVAAIAYINGASHGTGPLGLSQTLDATLQLNTTYTLSVQVGNIASGTGTGASAGLGFFDLSGFPGYAIQLLANDVLLAESTQVTADVAGIDPLPIAEGQFELRTAQVTIGDAHDQVGEQLEIRLINLNVLDTDLPGGIPSGIEVDFDDVQLDASPIPEPASVVLAVVGMLCVARRSRKPQAD